MSFDDSAGRIVSAVAIAAILGTACPSVFAQAASSTTKSGPALAETAPTETPPAPDQTFAGAVGLFKEGRFAEALPTFTSVATSTASPNAWLYVGHCLVRLERYPEAHIAFSTTLSEIARRGDDKYETTRQAAAAQLDWLGARVSRLVVAMAEPPQGLVAKLDGQVVDPLALASGLVLVPGAHRVEAMGEGVRAVTRKLELSPGETKNITLSFEAATVTQEAPPRPALPPAPATQPASGPDLFMLGLVAGGVGVAGLGVFAIAGLKAKSTYDGLSEDCSGGGCTSEPDKDRVDSGKSQQTIANIGLVVGVAGALASGTLLYLDFSRTRERQVSFMLSPSGTRVAYTARF